MRIWAIFNDFDVCLTIWVLLYAHFMHFCVIYLTWWCPYHHHAGSCIRREFPCLLMFFKCVIVHDFSATLLEACALIKPAMTDDWAAEDKINAQKRNYLPKYLCFIDDGSCHLGFQDLHASLLFRVISVQLQFYSVFHGAFLYLI